VSEPTFLRINDQSVPAPRGRKLLHVILDAGIPIATACGGAGRCHLCRVRIIDGLATLPPANATEKQALGNVLVAQGWRLACQTLVAEPLAVSVPVPRERRTGRPLPPPATPPPMDPAGRPGNR
jgi:adenylate cyclase